jgi:hypothetical protein
VCQAWTITAFPKISRNYAVNCQRATGVVLPNSSHQESKTESTNSCIMEFLSATALEELRQGC